MTDSPTKYCPLALRSLVLLAMVVLVLVGAAAWHIHQADGPALPATTTALRLSSIAARQQRVLEHWRIRDRQLGDIDFDLSRPLQSARLPVVTIVGGRRSDARLLQVLDAPGDNVVVIYHWPQAIRTAQGLALWWHGAQLVRSVNQVPAQIATLQRWLASQDFSDPTRMSLLGFSLGAEALPAAADLAQQLAAPSAALIIAYGGAPLAAVIESDRRLAPEILRHAFAGWLAQRFVAVEPLAHLPRLHSCFLILEGNSDRLISAVARDNLWRAVPAPKQRVVLAGNHIGLGRQRASLLHAIVATSGAWLQQQGAINPLLGS